MLCVYVCVFVCMCVSVALVFSLESLTPVPVGPFVVVSRRGLRGSELCVSGVMRGLERDINSCHEFRHAVHSSVTLKAQKAS